MAEDDEDSTLKKLAGLFVKLDEEPAPSEEEPTPSEEEEAAARTPPAPSRDAESGASSIMAADFDTLYEKTGVTGDPNADPLLNAFSGMSSLAEGPLRTAMEAMMRAMRADPAAVSETLARRIGVLTLALQQQKNRAAQQKQQRTNDLTTLRSTTDQEIQDLEKRIADLRAQVAAREESTQRQDAHDQGALAGFEQRVMQEQTRLRVLKDFLGKVAGQPAPARKE